MSGTSQLIKFSKTIEVGQYSSGLHQSFDTFLEATQFIETLKGSAIAPSDTERWAMNVYPGIYPENPFIPDFVHPMSVVPFGAIISGDSTAGKVLLSSGLGTVGNFVLIGALSSADVGLWVRNSASLYTPLEVEFGSIGAGDTLIFTDPSETITFAGGESTAAAVAAVINAQGVLLEAFDRWGRVEIRKTTDADLTLGSTGTANAALGFSTSQATTNNTTSLEVRRATNIVATTSTRAGVIVGDRDIGGAGENALENIIALLNGNGVDVIDGANAVLIDPNVTGNITRGLYLRDSGSIVETYSGKIINNPTDVLIQAGCEFRPHGTAYEDTTNNGTFTPRVPAESIKLVDTPDLFDIAVKDVEGALEQTMEARVQYLSPSGMNALVGTGPTHDFIGNAEVWAFAGSGIDRSVFGNLYVPDFDFGVGTVFKLRFNLAQTTAPDTTTTGNAVQWLIDVNYITAGDSITTPPVSDSYDEVQNLGGSVNERTSDIVVTLTSGNVTKNDMIQFEFKRSPGDVDDTYSAIMGLMGVELTFGSS